MFGSHQGKENRVRLCLVLIDLSRGKVEKKIIFSLVSFNLFFIIILRFDGFKMHKFLINFKDLNFFFHIFYC